MSHSCISCLFGLFCCLETLALSAKPLWCYSVICVVLSCATHIICSNMHMYVCYFFFFFLVVKCLSSTQLWKKLQTFEGEENGLIFSYHWFAVFQVDYCIGSGNTGILLKPYLNVQLQYLASLFFLPPFSPVSGHFFSLLLYYWSTLGHCALGLFLGMCFKPDLWQNF